MQTSTIHPDLYSFEELPQLEEMPRMEASAEKVLMFEVVDRGTNRQGKAITSSDGFTYGFHLTP